MFTDETVNIFLCWPDLDLFDFIKDEYIQLIHVQVNRNSFRPIDRLLVSTQNT